MRTLIRGGWVVAFGGATHALIRNGVVAYEGNRIIHVGAAFEGAVDATIDASGKLVMPGFVDVHVHSGDRAGHRLICDGGRPEYFGTPILDAGVRGRTHAPAPPSAERLELEATFTVAELLRNGITTFVEFGAHIGMQDAILAQVERFGIRSYLGPGLY